MKALITLLIFYFCFSPAATANYTDQPTLFVVGSSSLSKVIDSTRKTYFERTGINILVRPIGSDKGVVAIAEDVSDIGIISRYLTESEIKKWPNLQQHTIGQDAIIFLTHDKNPVTNINHEQVQNIYIGNISNWTELSVNYDSGITLFAKALEHGTLQSFLSYFGLNAFKADSSSLRFKLNGINNLYGQKTARVYRQINQAVGWVSRTENAIAFESLAAFTAFGDENKNAQVKLIAYESEKPLINNQINKNYQLKRPLNIVTRSSYSKEIKDYIAWLMSKEGQQILAKNAVIPVNIH